MSRDQTMMEKEFLKNKKGSLSSTLSWTVATVVIVLLVIFYFFAMGMVNSQFSSNSALVTHENFLNNGLEREFYTFLYEPVLVEGELFFNLNTISDLKTEGFSSDLISIDSNSMSEGAYQNYIQDSHLVSNGMEKYFRSFSNSRKYFLKNQTNSKKINSYFFDDEKFFGSSFIRIYSPQEPISWFSTTNKKYYGEQDDINPEQRDGNENICDPSEDQNAFSEAFISKDKKIIYCFKY